MENRNSRLKYHTLTIPVLHGMLKYHTVTIPVLHGMLKYHTATIPVFHGMLKYHTLSKCDTFHIMENRNSQTVIL
jgi:hypothetical protein